MKTKNMKISMILILLAAFGITAFAQKTGTGNTGADIPEEKLYTLCSVIINGGDGGSSGGNTFTPEDYAGCTTNSYTYTSKNLSLKIDVPKNRTEKTPFIIYVTGGSWTGGSVKAFENQSKYLATRGIAGVRVVYSYVKNGGTLQLGYEEMRAAYDFAVSKAEELNLDATRFGYCGASAGCTIAAYAAMTVPGCNLYIGCNGLYDLINLAANEFPARNSESMQYLSPYTRDQLRDLSPIRVIPATNIPAVALFHGTNDATIAHRQSVDFANTVEAAGGRAEMNSYAGCGHGFFNAGAFEDVTEKMYEFVRSVFGM
jgi:acetyl esterase/lipase